MTARILPLVLHALAAVLPLAGLFYSLPDVRLYGVAPPVQSPRWSLSGWLREEVQADFSKWLDGHLGLRGVLIRTDNTLFYSSLGESKPDATPKLGIGEVLFSETDLNYRATRAAELHPASELQSFAALVAEVQQRLEARGKRLVFITAPVKSALYFDAIPTRLRRRDPALNRTNPLLYEQLSHALTAAGVRFTDGRAVLTADPGPRELLFAPTGLHWTEVGACRVLRTAVKDIFPNLHCRFAPQPGLLEVHADFDLYRMLNSWHLSAPANHALKVQPSRGAGAGPRTLLVGSSFSWEFAYLLEGHASDAQFNYYNATFYQILNGEPVVVGPVKEHSALWNRCVLEKDLYVVELAETNPYGEHVLAFLTALREAL